MSKQTFVRLCLALLVAPVLFIGCDDGKSISANLPPPPIIHWDTVFVDGDISLGEPFLDVNNNHARDSAGVLIDFPAGEPYQDYSGDGKYQGPDDPWKYGIPWVNLDEDEGRIDVFDPPDSIHQPGEPNYYICVRYQYCFPLRSDCVPDSLPMCFRVSATSLDTELWATVEPNGFFILDHSLVCWIPEGSGLQEVRIIVRDSFWQTDTLMIKVYVDRCQGFD